MTNEQKQLLIKDLCARLPYGVKISYVYTDGKICGEPITLTQIDYKFNVEEVKPYLRPMSSMTDEELKELVNLCLTKLYPYSREFVIKETEYVLDSCWYVQIFYKDNNGKEYSSNLYVGRCSSIEEIDYLNAHHFDYRGLIPMGLALPAADGMYNF